MAVKKLIAIFLLLQIVSNNAFAEELIKFPRLFTHFYHHAHEHKDIKNFFDFLHKHYSDHHKSDSALEKHDGEEDSKLPFKHGGNCCVNLHAPTLAFVSTYLSADFNIVVLKPLHYANENDRIESNDLCSIWQPPKLA